MNLTVTNPADSTQTYTFGTRGKRPNWVNEGLKNGTIKVPEGYAPASQQPKTVETAKIEVQGPKAWKWVGLHDDDPRMAATAVRCVVVADTPALAITTLNKTMLHPVTASEFSSCWKEISVEEFSLRNKMAVYEFSVTEWIERTKSKLS